MISRQAQEIKSGLTKDVWREDISLVSQRREWEQYARQQPLASGTVARREEIAGYSCLWVEPEHQHKGDAGPVFFWVHGGGLIDGSALTHREFASRLSRESGCAVLLIDYPLAPEFPFPAARDCLTKVYQALISTRSPAEVIVAGDSSGAGLALSVVLRLRHLDLALPGGLVFISGVFDASCSGESMTTHDGLDPFTSRSVLEKCSQLYAPDINPSDPQISPLFSELSGLPPALVMVGEHEILLSDSVRLAERINELSGRALLSVYPHMWHTWALFGDFPEARQATEEICDFVHDRQPSQYI